jgi:hypothetical protein
LDDRQREVTKLCVKKAKKKVALPRRSWTINPVTRVKDSVKKYSRKRLKSPVRQEDLA